MEDHAETVNEENATPVDSASAEQGEQDASAGAATPPDSSPEEPSKGAEKRIRELTYKQREAERRAEEAERRAAELEAKVSARPEPEPAKVDDAPPLESDFDKPEDYREAMAKWTDSRLEARERARQQEAERATAAQRQAEQRRTLSDKLSAYAGENPTFLDDIETAGIQATPVITDFLVESDKAGAVLHYLAQNPEHAAKLEGASVAASMRELTRIEAQLDAVAQPQPSGAPDPITPLDDGGSASSEDWSGMTADEYARKKGYRLS